MQQTSYPRNYVSVNQQNFDTPRTLNPTNINDSTVFVINNDLGALKFKFFALFFFYIHILASHSTPTPNPRTLQAGDKMPHPSHIPDHMPAFPDPHTYIRTLVRTLLYQNYLETIKNAFEREATLVNVQFSEQFIWVKWIEVVIINNRITYMYIQEIFK